jgi:hypothetical protein
VRSLDPYYQPRNLCRHFWAVNGMMLLVLTGVAIALTVTGLLIAAPILAVVAGFNGWLTEGSPWWNTVGFGATAWGATLIIAVVTWNERRKPQRKYRGPGLFGSWWAARKERVCPLIEVTDDS